MSKAILSAIADLETQIAAAEKRLAKITAAAAPIKDELNVLLEEQLEVQRRVDAKVAELNAARGDPQAYIGLKKEIGRLASARMQLRQIAGLTQPAG